MALKLLCVMRLAFSPNLRSPTDSADELFLGCFGEGPKRHEGDGCLSGFSLYRGEGAAPTGSDGRPDGRRHRRVHGVSKLNILWNPSRLAAGPVFKSVRDFGVVSRLARSEDEEESCVSRVVFRVTVLAMRGGFSPARPVWLPVRLWSFHGWRFAFPVFPVAWQSCSRT